MATLDDLALVLRGMDEGISLLGKMVKFRPNHEPVQQILSALGPAKNAIKQVYCEFYPNLNKDDKNQLEPQSSKVEHLAEVSRSFRSM